jgi:hypothetical protein
VTAPIALHDPEPEYTENARQAGIQGDVWVALTVGAGGVPNDLTLRMQFLYQSGMEIMPSEANAESWENAAVLRKRWQHAESPGAMDERNQNAPVRSAE